MVIFIRDCIRAIVRNLGLSILFILFLTVLVRGFNPISETTGMIVVGLLSTLVLALHVYTSSSEVSNPLLVRLSKFDVTFSFLLTILYFGGTSQLMMM